MKDEDEALLSISEIYRFFVLDREKMQLKMFDHFDVKQTQPFLFLFAWEVWVTKGNIFLLQLRSNGGKI